ncbi:E3 ubiquitin-protein ligase SlrP [Kordia sp. SMS9]|uniref:leucine-rich repeat domain-containing protein n=1 Tax=Kordia sp. SMS9 TaxID=2282170 RepID=UPI000E0CE03D|nr:leucine-rich repeat domain-containing protein [Kordia sp. SMS9]AXG70355.1 E3 ubiquitin-protein ligase SlrP [Kordia sp. SMS9]
MLPELELTENEELGYYTTFDELFPSFTPYLQKNSSNRSIEVNFFDTDEETEPSKAQLEAHDFLVANTDQMLETLIQYLKQHEEYFMEFYGPYVETSYERKGYNGRTFTSNNKHGFPVVDEMRDMINYFEIGAIHICNAGTDGVAGIGFTGGCTWDEEHGFGAAFHNSKLLEVGDWNVGNYVSWSPEDEKEIANEFVDFHKLESLTERRKRLAILGEKIEVENLEDFEDFFDWLVAHNMIYGYRNTPVDIEAKEKVVLLNEIKKLAFYGKEIEAIPSSIQLLKNLTSLSFSFNKMDTIPIEICKLTALKSLTISSNQLERIPKQIYMLKNLEFLNLSRNKLQFVTEKIGKLPKLKQLDLSSNQLDQLPKSIIELKHLEKLFLQYNSFTSFPESVVNIHSLKTLNVATNQLTTIPESIAQLQHLEQLDVRFNTLTILPDFALINLPNLKWLQIVVNPFDIEYLEGLKLRIPEGLKTDIDSAISSRKDTLRRQKIEEGKSKTQQELKNTKKQTSQKTNLSNTTKKSTKKWWEFWRK